MKLLRGVMFGLIALPMLASTAFADGYLFETLKPSKGLVQKLSDATKAQDDKLVRSALLKMGFNPDVLNTLAIRYDSLFLPIDPDAIYIQNGANAGPKQGPLVFILAPAQDMPPPMTGCNGTGWGPISMSNGIVQFGPVPICAQ